VATSTYNSTTGTYASQVVVISTTNGKATGTWLSICLAPRHAGRSLIIDSQARQSVDWFALQMHTIPLRQKAFRYAGSVLVASP
jgi:hypothetical protein